MVFHRIRDCKFHNGNCCGGIVCDNATPHLAHNVLTEGGINYTPGALQVGTNNFPGMAILFDNDIAGGVTINGMARVCRNKVTGGDLSISEQADVLTNTYLFSVWPPSGLYDKQ